MASSIDPKPYSDCKIICEGTEFHLNKIILCKKSKVFDTAFSKEGFKVRIARNHILDAQTLTSPRNEKRVPTRFPTPTSQPWNA